VVSFPGISQRSGDESVAILMYRDARLLVMNERRMDALEEKCNGTVFLPSHIAGSSSAIVGGCQSSMVRVEHAACPHIRCRYSGFTYVSRYVARARGTATCYPLTDCSEQKRGGLVLHLVRALNRNEQRLFFRVFFCRGCLSYNGCYYMCCLPWQEVWCSVLATSLRSMLGRTLVSL
jgi:hypothetical protein